MNIVLVIGLTFATVGAFVGVLTLPRWLARNLGQDRMWRLRDDLVRDLLVTEILPKDHPAVKELLWKMDWALCDGRHFTLLHVYLVERYERRRLDQTYLNKLDSGWKRLDSLEPQQRDALMWYRNAFQTRLVASLLLGSWFGLAQVAWRLPRAIAVEKSARKAEAHRPVSLRRIESDVRESAKRAADQVVAETSLGKRLSSGMRDIFVSSRAPLREYEASPSTGTHSPVRAA
jgi:hypothetical protein